MYWIQSHWEKFLNINKQAQEEIETLPVESITADNIGNKMSFESGILHIEGKVHCVIYKLDGQKLYDFRTSTI